MSVQLNSVTDKQVREWIGYWHRANMVNFEAVQSIEQVYQARKYCACMRGGMFTDASDLQIWLILTAMRKEGFFDWPTAHGKPELGSITVAELAKTAAPWSESFAVPPIGGKG